MALQTTLQQRSSTAAVWTTTNPLLAVGEMGYETDTHNFKIGDGVTLWNSLGYQAASPAAAGKNYILNGGMDVWQRNTQTTATITGATAGTTTTYTAANTFVVGQFVQVLSAVPTTLNAAGVVTAASGTSFTIAATTTGTWTSGGTAYGLNVYTNPTVEPNTFTADRWISVRGNYTTGLTTTQQYSGLGGFTWCLRAQRNAGDTVTTQTTIVAHNIESRDALRFAGQWATISYYARAGANYSSAASAFGLAVVYGTGSDESIIVGFTGQTNITVTSVTLTTSWQRFSTTFLVPSAATELGIVFAYTPSGTAGANDYFELTGVQLENGTTATVFSRAGATYGAELALCQRYYWETPIGIRTTGTMYTTTLCYFPVHLPVTMRVPPTVTGSIANAAVYINGAGSVPTAVTLDEITTQSAAFAYTIAAQTAGWSGYVRVGARTSFSAEL